MDISSSLSIITFIVVIVLLVVAIIYVTDIFILCSITHAILY